MHGLDVTLRDINEEMLEKSKSQIKKSLDSLLEFDAIDQSKYEGILSHISMTTSVETAVKDAQFIQENGPERLNIKQDILADVEKYAPDTIYASSTSGLLISDIAKKAKHPERCVGAHPYNPPHLIPLVEITKGEKTEQEVVKLVYDFYQSIGMSLILFFEN